MSKFIDKVFGKQPNPEKIRPDAIPEKSIDAGDPVLGGFNVPQGTEPKVKDEIDLRKFYQGK